MVSPLSYAPLDSELARARAMRPPRPSAGVGSRPASSRCGTPGTRLADSSAPKPRRRGEAGGRESTSVPGPPHRRHRQFAASRTAAPQPSPSPAPDTSPHVVEAHQRSRMVVTGAVRISTSPRGTMFPTSSPRGTMLQTSCPVGTMFPTPHPPLADGGGWGFGEGVPRGNGLRILIRANRLRRRRFRSAGRRQKIVSSPRGTKFPTPRPPRCRLRVGGGGAGSEARAEDRR